MTGFRRLPLYSALILLILLISACGRKTAPVPPQAAIPAAIDDLSYLFSEDEVVLEWTYPQNSIDGQGIENIRRFILHKSELAADNYCPDCPATVTSIKKIDPVSTSPGKKVKVRDDRLLPGHHYSYVVISDRGWNIVSRQSNRISFWWQIPPAAPDSIETEESVRGVKISWEEVKKDIQNKPLKQVVKYQVYRKSGNSNYQLHVETDKTTYDDQLSETGNFHYRVRAVISYKGTVIPGPYGETVSFTPADRTPPPVPEIISIMQSNQGPRLLWERISVPDLAGYRIYRREAYSQEWNLIAETGPHAFSFTDESLSGKEGKWYYRISSFDQASPANESNYSREAGLQLTRN